MMGFSADSGAELARSVPTTVPQSPRAHQPRTPRTPRTPGRQDPNKTPRFYPVMKETGTIDGQVSSWCPYIQGVAKLLFICQTTDQQMDWCLSAGLPVKLFVSLVCLSVCLSSLFFSHVHNSKSVATPTNTNSGCRFSICGITLV